MPKQYLHKAVEKVPVTEYLDYRDYLAKVFSRIREEKSGYSYFDFSEDLKLSRSNVSWLIITGRRALTPSTKNRVVESLGLKNYVKKYFIALVNYNNARLPDKREKLFTELLNYKKHLLQELNSAETLEYFSKWYNPVVREMTSMKDFKSDPAWIAAKLYNRVLPKQAKECLELLETLKLIEFSDAEGRHKRRGDHVMPTREVGVMAAVRFHQQMIEMAREAVTRVPEARRDINAVTISASDKTAVQIKKIIHDCIKKVLQLEKEKIEEGDQVYQLNVQLFPFTR